MVQETCCRGDVEEKPRPWILSTEAKEVIHTFSVNLLEAAERIRQDYKFPNDPNTHFFPFNMQRFGYFTREAQQSYLETEQHATLVHVKGDRRFESIGALGFFDYKLDSGYRKISDFVKAKTDLQERLIIRFLNELGFLQTDVLGGERVEKENDFWEGYNISHPSLPIVAEFRRQITNHDLPHVWFRYHEVNEHQLSFDIPEPAASNAA